MSWFRFGLWFKKHFTNRDELVSIITELRAIRAELQLIRALLEPTGELRRYGPLEPLQPLGRTKQ